MSAATHPPAFIWGTFEDFLLNQWSPFLKALEKRAFPKHYIFTRIECEVTEGPVD